MRQSPYRAEPQHSTLWDLEMFCQDGQRRLL